MKTKIIVSVFLIYLFLPIEHLKSQSWDYGTSNSILYTDLQVGIGTSSPTANFEVYKWGTTAHARIYTQQHAGMAILEIAGGVASFGTDYSGWSIYHSSNQTNKDLYFRYGQTGDPDIMFSDDGAMGIGTVNTTGFKLAVNGSIRAKEIKVDTDWSDFVFEDDYQLPTLQEVESFIVTNKHLPDIPSAKEVEENGVNLGAMESKLLQKIEELTLYLLAQDKKIKALDAEIQQLKGE